MDFSVIEGGILLFFTQKKEGGIMSDAEVVLTEEERLKALLYQYLALYERWSEDRQLVVKRDADYAALLQAFSKHLQSFRDLVPAVRKDTVESLQHALKQALAE